MKTRIVRNHYILSKIIIKILFFLQTIYLYLPVFFIFVIKPTYHTYNFYDNTDIHHTIIRLKFLSRSRSSNEFR